MKSDMQKNEKNHRFNKIQKQLDLILQTLNQPQSKSPGFSTPSPAKISQKICILLYLINPC